MFLLLVEFIAFPERRDSLLSVNWKNVRTTASGSIGLYYNGKCHQTFPNATLDNDKKNDWCSNIVNPGEPKPWITYSFDNKDMRLKGFSLRSGCCWYDCCCINDEIDVTRKCCCEIYSVSLQGSNDNITWKTIHSIQQDRSYYYCLYKTFEFPLTESFKYVRLIQDEEYPGCPICMQLNQIEFYGELVESRFSQDTDENDESVSIIGKVNHVE